MPKGQKPKSALSMIVLAFMSLPLVQAEEVLATATDVVKARRAQSPKGPQAHAAVNKKVDAATKSVGSVAADKPKGKKPGPKPKGAMSTAAATESEKLDPEVAAIVGAGN